MTVAYSYDFLQFVARKNQVGQITPAQFHHAFNSAQRQHLDFLLGSIKQMQQQRVALGMSERNAMNLAPFKKSATITLSSGIATYPSDLYFLIDMLSDNTQLQRMDETKLGARLKSVIDPITSTDEPFYTEQRTGWKIYQPLTSVTVEYYRLPVDVFYNYTVDGNGRPVYNPTGSVQPEWDNVSMEDILKKAAGILGFSFQQQNLVEFQNQ